MPCTNRPIYNVTQDSEIPLIGCISFGVIDRGTNVLQIRPTSICVLSCIFCSTDAGPCSRWRQTEYIVELDYLLSTIRTVLKIKNSNKMEAHIDTVGDPLTYPKIVDLVHKLSEFPEFKVISLQTHGVLLNDNLIDELAEAGLSRINLSIDALDENLSKKLSGTETYDISRIISIAEYISLSPIDLLIAPVWVPGLNDHEIPRIIRFAKQIGAGKHWPPLGIQKYEAHKFGRKPPKVKPMTWYKFYNSLRALERKFKVKLVLKPSDFNIFKLPSIPIPFKRFEKVKMKVVGPGWLKGEKIAVARNRTITIVNAENIPIGTTVYARIIRVKHNIFIAKLE